MAGDNLNIQILVSTHKQAEFFDSEILKPIQVGSEKAPDAFENMLHDNEGDNISDLNPMYCELTAQYWAWKNLDCDYVGFCHYRRYFSFAGQQFNENEYGEVMEPQITVAAQQKYKLTDETIASTVSEYDVLTTGFKDLRKFPDFFSTPLEQYAKAKMLKVKDLENVAKIVKELYPDYSEDVDSYLNGNYSCFCNMYIMKKPIFNDYCEWLFSILQEFVKRTDMSHYSKECLRTPGHLAERLFNIFYKHAMRCNWGWKTKELQCVHFEDTDPRIHEDIAIADGAESENVIPIVLAADEKYAPMMTTTLFSMLENASQESIYRIFIFHKNICEQTRKTISEFFAKYPNTTIIFKDVKSLLKNYHLKTNNKHISVETYYRFLIQDALPEFDKVLYLDSDLIIEGDVSKLFKQDIEDNLLAAVYDIDYLGNLNMKRERRLKYSKDVLEMEDPYSYFQAGVLLLNTKELHKLKSVDEWLDLASNNKYIYNDQDILNSFCEGRVVYLDWKWNVMNDCAGRIKKVFSYAPAACYDDYIASRKQPWIVHYSGMQKPWNKPDCDEGTRYWSYARKTPFYERMLAMLGQQKSQKIREFNNKVFQEESKARSVANAVAPDGTARRELIRQVTKRLKF